MLNLGCVVAARGFGKLGPRTSSRIYGSVFRIGVSIFLGVAFGVYCLAVLAFIYSSPVASKLCPTTTIKTAVGLKIELWV